RVKGSVTGPERSGWLGAAANWTASPPRRRPTMGRSAVSRTSPAPSGSTASPCAAARQRPWRSASQRKISTRGTRTRATVVSHTARINASTVCIALTCCATSRRTRTRAASRSLRASRSARALQGGEGDVDEGQRQRQHGAVGEEGRREEEDTEAVEAAPEVEEEHQRDGVERDLRVDHGGDPCGAVEAQEAAAELVVDADG